MMNFILLRRGTKAFQQIVHEVMGDDLVERGFVSTRIRGARDTVWWAREDSNRSISVDAQPHRYDGPATRTFTINFTSSDFNPLGIPGVRLGQLLHGFDYWYELDVDNPTLCRAELAADWKSMGHRWLDAAESADTLSAFYGEFSDRIIGPYKA